MTITAATLCSGIGAPEAAMPDWRWLWCAEREAFPSEVLRARFGHPNLGDVTADDFLYRAIALGVPDVLVAGTPCQAFSIAGKRAGLADDRGNLTLVFVRICHAIADAARSAGRRAPAILWENVPGVLSQPDNAFGCFLGALVGADDALSPPRGESWPGVGMVSGPRARLAWRVLNAEHFGLAQRRERVFVVVDFGDGPDPAAVLFERKGLPGDYSPRDKAREKPAAGTLGAAGRGALWRAVAAAFADPRFGVQEVAGTLGWASQSGGPRTTDLDNNGALIPEVAWALQERDAKGADSDTKQWHLLPVALAINLRGREGGAMPELDDKASLRAASGGSSRSYVAFHGTQDPDVAGDISPPLGTNHGQECGIAYGWAVRRLTPVECARLQGFPDNHTRIAWRGKPDAQCPDGPQYKGYGNAMAVPVVRWILTRMETAMEATPAKPQRMDGTVEHRSTPKN